MSTFKDAVDLVLLHEGGYVHDPKDKGGETNYGISKRAFPNEDIKALTRDLAKVEQRMAELGRRKSDLEKKLSEPLAPQEIGALGLELQAVTDALAAAEEGWLALSEQIELEK